MKIAKEDFEAMMKQLFAHYGRELTEIGLLVYFEHLSNLEFAELMAIIKWCIGTQKFLPTPVEMLQSIAPSFEEIWSKLLKFSQELSGLRYDQYSMNSRKNEMLEELPEAVRDFLACHSISLLNLGYESDSQLKGIKKSLESHLTKSLAIRKQAILNGTKQALLN